MTDTSYKDWQVLSDIAIEQQIGAFVKTHRLRQNKTQSDVAKAANISRSTLSLLERGETVTLATLIQVLRVLDQLHVFQSFEVQEQLSPIALAKLERQQRTRARAKNKDTKP